MTRYSKTSTYNIIRVGLPITKETITEEFLSIVDQLESNEDWVGLTLCDYDYTGTIKRIDQHNAPAGYDVLLDRGFTFSPHQLTRSNMIIGTFGDLWGNRDPMKTTLSLLKLLRESHAREQFSTVVMFTPGSPYFDDAITKILKSAYSDMRIVDTESSADIAKRYIGGECVIRSHYDDFIVGKNPVIDKSKTAIFSCLQHGYNVDMRQVIEELQPKNVTMVHIALGDVEKITLTTDEFLHQIDTIFKSDKTYIFGFDW